MSKHFALVFLALSFSLLSRANPGDTTWVQANIAKLSWNGNYDTVAVFPSSNLTTTYRKIYMIFTLGKYQCAGYNPGNPGTGPGQTGWCGDWDYTVDNYLMTKTGDTVDLGRFITPYANALAPRTPWNAKQTYIYDVTDFYPILKDSATVRVAYSGYSGGFTANIKFAFIEGTPDRYVTGIKHLWHGYFGYGGASNTINNHFPAVNLTAPFNTQSANLKFIVTGHGSDQNGCCEFMPHFYRTYLNNSKVDSNMIWRPDCGANELYPQSGTWAYERGNWCPGALVYAHNHYLTSITASSSHAYQISFDSTYTSNPGGGGYGCDATLIYYEGLNKTLDASIEDVIAPTDFSGHFRENPICGSPTLHVKNSGSTAINSITFKYGLKDSALSSYTWTGSLASLSEKDIVLPDLANIDNLSMANRTDTFMFTAKILLVNGVSDNDSTNNLIYAPFIVAPKWPNPFVVNILTNNAGVNGVNNGVSETDWKIYDMNNNLLFSRTNMSLSTSYYDTIAIGPTGCYKLVVEDGGCDGLNWWVHSIDNSGISTGYFQVTPANSLLPLTLNGDFSSSLYPDDFGCGFVQYFTTVGTWPAGVKNISAFAASIEAYPNPAQALVNVKINGLTDVKGTLILFDALGRVVMNEVCNNATQSVNISAFANGVYTLVYTDERSTDTKLQARLVIAK